jgi:hypothetical protein
VRKDPGADDDSRYALSRGTSLADPDAVRVTRDPRRARRDLKLHWLTPEESVLDFAIAYKAVGRENRND